MFVTYGDHADVEAGTSMNRCYPPTRNPWSQAGRHLPRSRGDRLPDLLTEFLEKHGKAMPRAAYRIPVRERRLTGAD